MIPNRACGLARKEPGAAPKQTRHIGTDSLGLLALGDLPIYQRAQVEEHLAGCAQCRSALRRVTEIVTAFRTGSFARAA